ncbi:MAG: NACHT domain-containing protein, partial [Chloroflexota bacterium]
MRQALFVLVLLASLFFPVTVRAQGPTPPPSLAEICYPEGKFHIVECVKAVWDKAGLWGVGILVLGILIVYLFVTPAGKAFQTWFGEMVGNWLRSFSKPTHPAEVQRREDEYLLELEKSETLRQPDEIASQFDRYLNALHDRENPLRPSEEKVFVELESGLSIPPRIGLSLKVESEQSRSFVEQKTFNDLAEAMNCMDDQTGCPYPALALLGEPGSGKSTLLRKFARQIVGERIQDSTKLLPIFVSLSAHKNGSPLTFLRGYWKKTLGFDGLDDALANGRVWLFLDGLNEMPRDGYDRRVMEWRTFLRQHCPPNGNRAVIACRIADYGEGVDVPRLMIHAMDDDRIQQFLKKRTPDHAETLWKALEKDRGEGRGAMYELAQIPFWLVMISRLSGKDGLPRNRADLISKFIREWLDYESNRPGGRTPSDIQRDAFTEGMTQLAWTGLSRSQNYTFRLEEARSLLGAKQAALDVKDVLGLAQDCSLLSIESNGLRFQHQLLQEYFAARELARRFLTGRNLTKLWKTPWRRWKFVQSRWDPLPPPPLTGWEEAVILAAGMLDVEQAQKLTLAILSRNPPLSARCALESGVNVGEAVSEKVTARLQAEVENSRVRLPARLAAGKTLAKLGDPRLLKQRCEIQLEEGKTATFIMPDWVQVPTG